MRRMISQYDSYLGRYMVNPSREDTNLISLNEFSTEDGGYTYVGKTKNLQQIEIILGELMQNLYADMNEFTGLDRRAPARVKKEVELCRKVENSKELKAICKLFEKEFGFQEMTINVTPILIMPTLNGKGINITSLNAFALPQSYFVRDITTGMPSMCYFKDRFYDEKHVYHCGIVLASTFLFTDFTPAEVLAVLLHEIGHNFEVAITSYFKDLLAYIALLTIPHISWFQKSVLIGVFRALPDLVIKYGVKLMNDTIIDNIPLLATIFLYYGKIKNQIDKFRYLNRVMKSFTNLSNLLLNPGLLLHPFLGFGSERAADSLPTVYGYGDAQISALKKLGYHTEVDKGLLPFGLGNITVFNNIYSCINNLLRLHPDEQTRCRMILNDMEILTKNKDFPPHIQTMIRQDYELAKDAYDNYVTMDKSESQSIILHKLWRYLGEKIFKGQLDIRAYILNTSYIQQTLLQRAANKIRGVNKE